MFKFLDKRKQMLLLVDSRRYIESNCYQSQLLKVLQGNYNVTIYPLDAIKSMKKINVKKYDVILSVLKLRTLVDVCEILNIQLSDAPLFIYEQDPWESYIDDSPYIGSYEKIYSTLNVKSFLNTSYWWSEFIRSKSIPSSFVRMGMLPDLCKLIKAWDQREFHLAFQGSLHEHRKLFFSQLRSLGLNVNFLPSLSYKRFLSNLNNIQIYIHTERSPWKVHGELIPRNALWIKDVEAAARGCFAIRDYEKESFYYGIQEIPTIYTYREIEEIPEIVEKINSLSSKEKMNMMVTAVEVVKKRNDWMTVIRALEEHKTQ